MAVTDFYIQPGMQGGFTGLAQAYNYGQDKEAEQVAMQKQEQEKLHMQDVAKRAYAGDDNAIGELFSLNKDMGAKADQMNQDRLAKMGLLKKQAADKANYSYSMDLRFAKTPEEKQAVIDKGIADPVSDLFDGSDIGKSIEQMELESKVSLFSSVGKDKFKELLSTGGDGGSDSPEFGTVGTDKFTVDSMAKYQNSGNIKDLVRYSPKTVEVAGVTHSLNSETQKWEPIIDATSAQLTNQAKAIATLEADKKSRIGFAKSKTAWRTGRPKFKSKIASSKASQKILEATSKQLKDNINNWSTKYGASLSSLPGSEARRLKNQLNTLKAHSAFSTLTDLKDSGGTLGAISEAELVLLEAKLGALDQGGDATELARVIDQIVNSNISSIGRLEKEFYNTTAMYNLSFDEFQSSQNTQTQDQTQESTGAQEGARATNQETGQVAIFTNGQWVVQ